jgi:single-strand DNA-binding protein
MEVSKMSLNRVTIIGHLGQEPELRYLANGQAVGRFSVATDEPYTDKEGKRQERTEWHQIVVFAKVAEACEKYLARGRQVYVEGRLRTREYEARNNGGKRQRTEIVASRVQFLGTPPTDAKGATAVEEPVPPADSEVPF